MECNVSQCISLFENCEENDEGNFGGAGNDSAELNNKEMFNVAKNT